MLDQLHRLKKNNDITRVLKEGKKNTESFLIVKTIPNDLKETRFAFIVSKKFSKKAVERNRIRRQISEAIRDNLSIMKGGIDVVILSMSGVSEWDSQIVKEIVKKLLIKAKLIT